NNTVVLAAQPVSTLEEGWLDVTGDERCTTTSYANNVTANMFNYPAVNIRLNGDCSSPTVLTRQETSYDGGELGAAPTHGDATKTAVLLHDNTFATTFTTPDAFGRPTIVLDPNNNKTTTQYVVTSGGLATDVPIEIKVTNPLEQQVITDFQPEFA